MCFSNYSSMIDYKWAKGTAEFLKNCDAENTAWWHLAEAKLFVAGVNVGDDRGHYVPQGLLPGRIQPSLLLHDLPDDLCNQLARKTTFRQVLKIRQEITTQEPEQQPHLEVHNGDLVLGGMTVGERLKDFSVVALGLQELTKFFQHSGSVGRDSCVTCQLALGNANKLGEELLGLGIFCE